MRILLVTPTHKYPLTVPLSFSDFPTGFGYLAAGLKRAGHRVYGCNPNNLEGYPSARLMLHDVLKRSIDDNKPNVIGLGGLCTDYLFLADAISIIRSYSKAFIVLGGQIITNDPGVYELLKPDFGITGEADICMVELCNMLEIQGLPYGG